MTDSILRLARVSAAGYDLRLTLSTADSTAGYNLRLILFWGWLWVVADSNFSGSIRVTSDYILRLTRVPTAGYNLRLILSCGWLRVAADSSSGGMIRVTVDSILGLTTSCGWFYPAADWVPPAGLDLRLTYTLIYQVNLRTYSAKCIIFMFFSLPPDFSYHWFRLWLLLEETWPSLNKLEETWRSFKTLAATDSSCSDWFKLRQVIRGLWPIDYLQIFDSNAPL